MQNCSGTLFLPRCETLDDIRYIRQSYRAYHDDTRSLVVNMAALDDVAPAPLLLGMLLNLRRHFHAETIIELRQYPPYLPLWLQICRRDHLFLFNGDTRE